MTFGGCYGSLDFAVPLKVAALQYDFIKCPRQHNTVGGFGFLSQICLLRLQLSHIWLECNAKH